MNILGFLDNKYVFMALGSLGTLLLSKIQNKTGSITYSMRADRIALSSEDPIFGSVKITWQNATVPNLYSCSIEVENSTFQDFENMRLRLYSAEDTFLLNERTAILDSPYAVDWSPEFKETMKVDPGPNPTDQQRNIYNHSREYLVPVFNRNQKLSFSLLCTRPGSMEPPMMFVSTLTKGVRVRHQTAPNIFWGVPANVALIRGLILTVAISVLTAVYVKSLTLAVALGTVAGLACTLLGALEYKLEKALRNWIAG